MFQLEHFSAFYLLGLVPLVVLLYAWFSKWQSKQIKKLGDAHLVANSTVGFSAQWNRYQVVLLALGIVLLISTLAGFKSNGSMQTTKTKSREIVFALDLSNSMNAADVQPSRLIKAKQLIQQLIDTNGQDKFGLVVFAGNAYISVPITIDAASIQMNLSAMETNTLPSQGTNIAEALQRSLSCFNLKKLGAKAIVLITDGEDHEEGIADAVKECKDANVALICVGVGTQEGFALLEPGSNQPKLDENGQAVISKLNEAALLKIVNNNSDNYVQLQTTSEAALQINAQCDKMLSAEMVDEQVMGATHYYQWFLLPAIVLLGMVVFYTPKPKVPSKLLSVFFIIFLMQAASANAQSAQSLMQQGNQLYRQKKYAEAAEQYQKIEQNKSNTNLQQAQAAYNLGNCFAKQNKWQEAVDTYTQSLKLNPSDANAKYNLCYAKRKLEKQQQQDKKKQDQQKKQDDQIEKSKKDSEKAAKQKNQNEQQEQTPNKPQPSSSKLSKQQAEQYLNALKEQEKKLLQKKLKGNQGGGKQKKDW
jgi:Ca-activated chloride channel homolog